MTGTEGRLFGRALVATVGLIAVVAGLDVWYGLKDGLGTEAWVYLLERLFFYAPMGAALLIGQARRVSIRLALGVCAAVTLLMAAQDLAPARESTVEKRAFAYNLLDGTWANRSVGKVQSTEGGSFPLLLDYASGEMPRAEETTEAYTETDARLHVSYAFWKLGYLLAPFVAIGAVLGTRVWVGRNLRARTRGAERVMLFVLTWIVGPGAAIVVAGATEKAREVLLFAGWLPLILLPPIGLAVAAWLGWRAAAREDAVRDTTDLLPATD